MEHAPQEQAEIVVDAQGIVTGMSGDGRDARYLQTVRLGRPLIESVHPEDRAFFALTHAHVIARADTAATIAIRWARPLDRWSPLLVHFAHDGGLARVTLKADDAQAARRAEAQMRRVVEASAQGIIVRTATEVLYMNEAFARLLGYSSPRECIQGEPSIDRSIHPDDVPLVLSHLKARIAGEETVSNYEFRLQRHDGREIWVETRAAIVFWDGKPASLSWINDISDRKAMEVQLRSSKEAAEFANRSKTEFLANMSHELRTPLNAILGFSEIMQKAICGPLNAKYLEYAGDIHGSGEHLLALVNDVLDLAKLESGKHELHESNIRLAELAEECIALVRGHAGDYRIRVTAAVPQTLPALRADRRALKQLLLNLLSNALKFTPEDGEVTVVAEQSSDGGIVLSVRDSGIGMNAPEIEVALSPFGQIDSELARKHKGTGLGLSICRSLMHLHGGRLQVSSERGKGATFSAFFPASRTVITPRASAL